MRRRRTTLGGTVLVGAVALASCGTGTGALDPEDSTAGMGVPRLAVEEFAGAPRTVRARLHVADNGCFLGSLTGDRRSRRYLVVWPTETELGSSGDELVLPDGTTVRHGDVLAGAGMLAPTRQLEGFGTDGYWDHAVGYCTPRASEVLVLEPGAAAASAAFDAEERALVRRAVRRLEEFEALDRRLLAAGEATEEARRLYERWLRDWEPYVERLRRHAEGTEIARNPVVLSTRAVSVQVFQDLAADVVLRRCVDLADLGTTRDGATVPSGPGHPVVQEVVVHRYENRTWRIGTVETTEERCAG